MSYTTKSKKIERLERLSVSEYRLYDSIKHIGLLQPLVYTKNRDTQEYELYGGGGTRLRLLDVVQQERKETGLEPFLVRTVVRDKPATSKEISLSHLIQNHVRQRRKFIDRALHLNDCIETREAEIERKMSQRETVHWLRQCGFPISQSLLNDLQFTAKRLYSLLPQALGNGMGRRQIVNIRKLNRGMREVWRYFGENSNNCREAFEDICDECDEENFDIELFREIMEREICLWCDLNSQYVRAMLQVDHVERARLIDAIVSADRTGSPLASSLLKPTEKKGSRTVFNVPISKFVPIVYDLPPAVLNRRKRYARRLALDLAESANLLDCVSGSMTNTIGYCILKPPNTADSATHPSWQLLHYCQQAVQSDTVHNQRLGSGWRFLNRAEFSNVCSLIELTRTLCDARHVTKIAQNLQKAA